MSVQQHCLSPLSKGLFHRAVMASGSGASKLLSAGSPEKYFAFWQAVMERCGCADLAAFRALEPKTLFSVWQSARKEIKGGGQACNAVLDGELIVGNGTDILSAGEQIQIPYLCGTTSEDVVPPVLHTLSRNWCAAQSIPSYTWFFDRRLPGDDNGAWHSSDLWYWFGTLDNCWRPMEQKDYDLSRLMVSYLTNFVKTGNPNKAGQLPTWIASDKSQKKVMCLGEQPAHMGKPSMLRLVKTMLCNKAVGE